MSPALSGVRRAKTTSLPTSRSCCPVDSIWQPVAPSSGMPNIVMEVVAEGSVEIDYVKKSALYARTGAQEYWIIDWLRQSIEVWTFIGQAAQVVTYTSGQTITTPLLPNVSISVEDLLS